MNDMSYAEYVQKSIYWTICYVPFVIIVFIGSRILPDFYTTYTPFGIDTINTILKWMLFIGFIGYTGFGYYIYKKMFI
jgi:hypothetical protein